MLFCAVMRVVYCARVRVRVAYPGVGSRRGFLTSSDRLRLPRGHQIVKKEGWSHGKVLGIRRDGESGLIHGAASAKNNIGYALGW